MSCFKKDYLQAGSICVQERGIYLFIFGTILPSLTDNRSGMTQNPSRFTILISHLFASEARRLYPLQCLSSPSLSFFVVTLGNPFSIRKKLNRVAP